MSRGHVRRDEGKLPRIVRAPRRNEVASSLIETAVEVADRSTAQRPLLGYVVMAFYKGGGSAKNVYEPDDLAQGLSKDMFWVLNEIGLRRLMINHMADHKAVDVHNRLHDLDDED